MEPLTRHNCRKNTETKTVKAPLNPTKKFLDENSAQALDRRAEELRERVAKRKAEELQKAETAAKRKLSNGQRKRKKTKELKQNQKDAQNNTILTGKAQEREQRLRAKIAAENVQIVYKNKGDIRKIVYKNAVETE